MKETELRNELKETIKDMMNLTKLIRGNLEAIDRFGRELFRKVTNDQRVEDYVGM
jgi:hypothetical protein